MSIKMKPKNVKASKMLASFARSQDLACFLAFSLIVISTVAAPTLASSPPIEPSRGGSRERTCTPFGKCRPRSCLDYKRDRRPCLGNEILVISSNRDGSSKCRLQCLNEDGERLARCKGNGRFSRFRSRFRRLPCSDADPCDKRVQCPAVSRQTFISTDDIATLNRFFQDDPYI